MHLCSLGHCVFITLSMFLLTCEIFCQFGERNKKKPKNFIISEEFKSNSNPQRCHFLSLHPKAKNQIV